MEDYIAIINTDDNAKEFGEAIIKAVIKTNTTEQHCKELMKRINNAKIAEIRTK